MFKNMGLKGQIIIPICTIISVILIGLFAWILEEQYEIEEDQAVKLANSMAKEYGYVIKAEVEVAMDATRTLAQTFESLIAQDRGGSLTRAEYNEILTHVLKSNPSFLGVCTVWEPNALDGKDSQYKNALGHDHTGAYYPWVFRSGDDIKMRAVKYPYDKEYYVRTKRDKQEFVMEPATYDTNGKMVTMTDLFVPILKNGVFKGLVSIAIAVDRFKEMINEIRPFETGAAYLMSNKGILIAHPDQKFVGKQVVDYIDPEKRDELAKAVADGKPYQFRSYDNGVELIEIINPIFIGKDKNPWSLGVSIPKNKVMEHARRVLLTASIVGIFTIILLIGVVYYIVQKVVASISRGVDVTQAISRGNLKQTVAVVKNDEVGAMGHALNHMTKMLKMKEELAKRISDGDLTTDIILSSDEDELGKALQGMKDNLSEMIEKIQAGALSLSSSLTELSAISSQMSNATTEMSSQSTTVAGAAEQITAGISTMASSNSEMHANVQSIATTSTQISRNMEDVSSSMDTLSAAIHQVSEKSGNAQGIAKEAIHMSNLSTAKMNELSESAHKIGEFSQIIKEIAQQTNLLALNANIEAASAGEAGKGFAVVANEIKELANQSSRSAEDISATIAEIQQNTESSVQSMKDVSNIITNIDQSTSEISELSKDGAENVNMIVSNVKESTVGVNQVSDLINEISSATDESAKTSAEFSQSAGEITRNMQELNLVVNETATGVTQVHKETTSLSVISEELKKMVDQFKLH